MRALTFHAPEDVSFEEVDEPLLEQPSDAIVRVSQTAICGSDLHVYFGRETGIDKGTVMGHEFVGEIVALGESVQSLTLGDRVVSPFTTNCGGCFYCKQGLTCRCEQGQLFGWVEESVGLQGAQAEYVRVPLAASSLVRLPPGVAASEALFAGDIMATGMFAADLAALQPGAIVVVIGCGPVGLMAVIAALEKKPEKVYAVDSVGERLRLARQFGAETLDLSDFADPSGIGAVVREQTNGRGADAVLEVVGSPDALRSAFDLVRPGGVIASVGVHTEPELAFSPQEAYDKNLTYRTGRCPARRYMDEILQIIQSGRYDLDSIVSHRLPLAHGPEGYRIFANKLDRCTKVVLQP